MLNLDPRIRNESRVETLLATTQVKDGHPTGWGSLFSAEAVECTCPDFCERDHANE
jgi:hypothetical protein